MSFKIQEKKLNTDSITVPGIVNYKEVTESTNLDAKRADNVPDKSVFLADAQTGGRGRLGREWSSPSGDGIWMSIYLKPQIDIRDISQITLIAGLSVSNIIENSFIKWPNDIILSHKKVGGILTEMSTENGLIKSVIVGIGINVNNTSFDDDLKDKATSIFIETGKTFNREKLICDITKEFFSLYDKFLVKGFSVFKEDYVRKCITLNRDVCLIKDNEKQIAKAVDINDNGELVVEISGRTIIVNSCEVSVRGLLGYV